MPWQAGARLLTVLDTPSVVFGKTYTKDIVIQSLFFCCTGLNNTVTTWCCCFIFSTCWYLFCFIKKFKFYSPQNALLSITLLYHIHLMIIYLFKQ